MPVFKMTSMGYWTVVFSVICVVSILPCCVICGRCQSEQHTVTPIDVCNFNRSAISSLIQTNISSQCQFLDLSNNQLQTVENSAFSKQSNLLYLDLSFNEINFLQSGSFSGLHHLVCLDLNQNKLNFTYEAYPKAVFLPLTKLKILDIRHNFYATTQSSSPDISFQVLVSLEELFLDLFSEVTLGPGFSYLQNLKVLGATSDDSHLCSLTADFFVSFENLTISMLLLTHCHIEKIYPKALSPFGHLEHLSLADNPDLGLEAAVKSLADLSNAPLSSIDFRHVNSAYSGFQDQVVSRDMGKYLIPFCFRSLDLSDNLIVHVDFGLWHDLKSECLEVFQIRRLYLQRSQIINLLLISLRFRNLRKIDLANSMLKQPAFLDTSRVLEGETHLSDKRGWVNLILHPKLEILNMSHTSLNCYTSGPEIVINSGLALRVFDFSYTDAEHCFHRHFRGIENLKTLAISGNLYGNTLNSNFVSSFPNLTCLIMRDTPLMSRFQTDRSVLSSLKQLQHLDIANSELTSLNSIILSGLLHLKFLDLSFNKLISVPDFNYLAPSLQELDMRSNALISFSIRDRQNIDTFFSVNRVLTLMLDGNPLACNCDTYDFVEWVWTTKVTFDNNENYSCAVSNGSEISLLSLRENFRDLQIRCISSFWVTFGALAASVLFVVILALAIVFRYRIPIKYWCHTVCRKPAAKPSQRHKYDALVAYCHQDYRWVCQTLYPKLTDCHEGTGYKLCVYDRDFLPGVSIEENIISAINDSFKIILVISPAFVQSVWCQFEMQMVRRKMIQVGREDVVIPIILKDVPVSLMPKSLLNLWNISVFLVWSESPGEQRHFWSKLLAALGPVRVSVEAENNQNGSNEESVNPDIIEMNNEPVVVLNCGEHERLLAPLPTDDDPLLVL